MKGKKENKKKTLDENGQRIHDLTQLYIRSLGKHLQQLEAENDRYSLASLFHIKYGSLGTLIRGDVEDLKFSTVVAMATKNHNGDVAQFLADIMGSKLTQSHKPPTRLEAAVEAFAKKKLDPALIENLVENDLMQEIVSLGAQLPKDLQENTEHVVKNFAKQNAQETRSWEGVAPIEEALETLAGGADDGSMEDHTKNIGNISQQVENTSALLLENLDRARDATLARLRDLQLMRVEQAVLIGLHRQEMEKLKNLMPDSLKPLLETTAPALEGPRKVLRRVGRPRKQTPGAEAYGNSVEGATARDTPRNATSQEDTSNEDSMDSV